MRSWARSHGLLVVNLVLFVLFFVGMVLTGVRTYDAEQVDHGWAPLTLVQYLGTGKFLEATFENWESEFLQMGMYVLLTAYLFQRGSSESKPIGEQAEQDQDPRSARTEPGVPWPVRRGGWVLRVYENSLAGMFFLLFLASVVLHAYGGARAYTEEQLSHGGGPVSFWQYLGTSQFWFESFQNWQSEFMVVALMVGASVYLRQRGSEESKPVAASHHSNAP